MSKLSTFPPPSRVKDPARQPDQENETPTAPQLDWNTDSINPLNWSLKKRIFHSVIPASFAFVVTFASSIYTAAVPEIINSFKVSQTVALLPFSLFLVGLGFGPVLAAPLSEQFGRTATYQISLPLFALFNLGAGLSPTFTGLTICRFLAGVVGSPPLVVGAGTNADIWLPRSRAAMATLFAVCPYLGPALGPLIGGYTAASKGWEWTQWVILIFSAAVYIPSLMMQETYKKAILSKRDRKLGVDRPRTLLGLVTLRYILSVTFIRPISMLYSEPIVIVWSLYIGFAFAVVYSFFTAYPYVFTNVYGLTIRQTGLTFLSIAIGSVVGAIHVILVDRLQWRRHFTHWKSQGRQGNFPPEYRLYSAMAGSILIPIGLFWFAWTARSETHWIVSIVAGIFTAWGNMCIFMSGLLYLLDVYEALLGASAVAATTLLRYLLAAGFPLFINRMYSNLGVRWAASVFGFISLALMPIPWVLFKWGSKLRASSLLATD